MIRWDDTPPPNPRDVMDGVLASAFALIAPLGRAGFQHSLRHIGYGYYELYVDPSGYTLARACVWYGTPMFVLVDVIPLEI